MIGVQRWMKKHVSPLFLRLGRLHVIFSGCTNIMHFVDTEDAASKTITLPLEAEWEEWYEMET